MQDLTHTVSPGFPVFPGSPPMEVARSSTIEVNGSNARSPVDYPCSSPVCQERQARSILDDSGDLFKITVVGVAKNS